MFDRFGMKRATQRMLQGILMIAVLIGGTAWAADVVGNVLDGQNNAVSGVKINVIDHATGKVVGEGITNSKGLYEITGLSPGKYDFALNPLNTGFQAGTISSEVTNAGLTLNWTVSPLAAASAVGTAGATAAVASTGIGALGVGAIGVSGIGAAVGGVVAAGGLGGGGGGGPVSPSL